MPYFIRLVSFTSEGLKEVNQFKDRREEFMELGKQVGVKVIAEYVTLGRYDIVTILEAPDINAVLKLSAKTGSKGRTRVETLSAVPADIFEKIAASI